VPSTFVESAVEGENRVPLECRLHLASVSVIPAQLTACCLVHLNTCSITLQPGCISAHHTFCTGSISSMCFCCISVCHILLVMVLWDSLKLPPSFFCVQRRSPPCSFCRPPSAVVSPRDELQRHLPRRFSDST
jgi:hypothetical protein